MVTMVGNWWLGVVKTIWLPAGMADGTRPSRSTGTPTSSCPATWKAFRAPWNPGSSMAIGRFRCASTMLTMHSAFWAPRVTRISSSSA